MVSLFLRALFFTILQPGIIVGFIPFLIVGKSLESIEMQSFNWFQILGLILFLAGLFILVYCIISFAVIGRGTISPADPTQKLVAKGFYKISRNPMYVSSMMILIGESLIFRSIPLGIYTLIVLGLLQFFIVCIEEPRLKRDFGDAYEKYCSNVRRWI